MKIEVSGQVLAFIHQLAPEPRKMVRLALKKLATGQGDVRALEADLAGFYRLRITRYRIIFHYVFKGGQRILRCEFAEERSLVYQLYAEMVRHMKF